MAKKSAKSRGRKRTPATKRARGARTAAGRGGRRKTGVAARAKRRTGRKTAKSARPAKVKSAPRGKKRSTAKRAKPTGTRSARRVTRVSTRSAAARGARKSATKRPTPQLGGTGREETLAQTPEAGRSRRGPTNPMPTKRSTGTPAGAGTTRSPRLDRARRTLREVEEGVQTPPSSLDLDRLPSAARTGREHLQHTREEHNETSPVLTGGDVDADWEEAYAVGDETPGGDNPTPDQDRVDDIGKALGVEYQDNEELKASEKIAERDRHRWELDPASAEDYRDRD